MTSRIAATLLAAALAVIPAAVIPTAVIPTAAGAAPAEVNPWAGLVDAAAQRLLTAEPVAVAKWHTHQPIDDPAREHQVLASVAVQGSRLGLDREYVHRIFRDQLDATTVVESARIAAWTRDPASAPPAGAGLSAVRTRIDALNHIMVERIAANTAAAHDPTCRTTVAAATAGAATRHRLDPVTARALIEATRDYCV